MIKSQEKLAAEQTETSKEEQIEQMKLREIIEGFEQRLLEQSDRIPISRTLGIEPTEIFSRYAQGVLHAFAELEGKLNLTSDRERAKFWIELIDAQVEAVEKNIELMERRILLKDSSFKSITEVTHTKNNFGASLAGLQKRIQEILRQI